MLPLLETCFRAVVPLVTLLAAGATPILGQAPVMSLEAARSAARRASPELRAAEAELSAARARERQAGAAINPLFVYAREQVSGGGLSNSQHLFLLEQGVELGGTRGARRDAATGRREVAEARVTAVALQLDADVARAWAEAAAADRRATLADEPVRAFGRALRISEQRLGAGDISGYANRRIKLEAARYAALRAEAVLARRRARLALAELLATGDDSLALPGAALGELAASQGSVPPADSLLRLAEGEHPDLRIAERAVASSGADLRLARRERIPVPRLTAGLKTERVAGTTQTLTGFAGGLSLPLPLWDRRAGAVDAAAADVARRRAELDGVHRRVVREVLETRDAWLAAREQLAILAPQLGPEAGAALHAAQVAYAEGEITLAEWLDAARAYHDAEATLAAIQAELIIRFAALERAVGARLNQTGSRP